MALLKLRSFALSRNGVIAAVAMVICITLAVAVTTFARRSDKLAEADLSEQSRRVGNLYYPTPKQWASLSIAPVIRYKKPRLGASAVVVSVVKPRADRPRVRVV